MNNWTSWNNRFWERNASDNEIMLKLNERAKEGWDREALLNAIQFFGLKEDKVIQMGNSILLKTLGFKYRIKSPKKIVIDKISSL
jgi:hypothetical protein